MWNVENTNKVLRDERLHREEVERKAEHERSSILEKNLDELIRKGNKFDNSASSSSVTIKEEPERFRLFGDFEEQQLKAEKSAARSAEEEAKLSKLKKINGIEDWALGGGSRELSKTKAWYETSSVSTAHAAPAVESRQSSHSIIDPMRKFLKVLVKKETCASTGTSNSANTTAISTSSINYGSSGGDTATALNLKKRVLESCSDNGCLSDKFDNERRNNSVSRKKEKYHRHSKEEKHKKKKKKEKKHNNKIDGGNESKDKRRSTATRTVSNLVDVGLAEDKYGDKSSTEKDFERAALRAKRLVRERQEHKRANILLTRHDIYGDTNNLTRANISGNSDDIGGPPQYIYTARKYNQQYNPQLSRR